MIGILKFDTVSAALGSATFHSGNAHLWEIPIEKTEITFVKF